MFNAPLPYGNVSILPLNNKQRALVAKSDHCFSARSILVDISGKLDLSRLRHSLNIVAAKHVCLRSILNVGSFGPCLRILSVDEFKKRLELCIFDQETLVTGDADINDFVLTSFNVEKGPLLRVGVFRAYANRFQLAISVCSLISDQDSLKVLLRDLLSYYLFLNGAKIEIDRSSSRQYARRHALLCKKHDEQALQFDLQYWKNTLQGAMECIPLPMSNKCALKKYSGESSVDFTIPHSTLSENRLCQKFQFEIWMLSAWIVVFIETSKQYDLIVGVVSTCKKKDSSFDRIIEDFETIVPLRLQFNNQQNSLQVVEQVDAELSTAIEHSEPSIVQIAEETGFRIGDLADDEFQVLINISNFFEHSIDSERLSVKDLSYLLPPPSIRTALEVHVHTGADASSVQLRYSREKFTTSTIALYKERFITVLSTMLTYPYRYIV